MDTVGLQTICDMADNLAAESPLFSLPESIRSMAAAGETFYGNMQAKGQ